MTDPPTAIPKPQVVYKVLRAAEWAAFQTAGQFAGSPDDLRDGFVHLSTREQLPGTLAKHFAGLTDLVVLELEVVRLGAALRWESSRGGTQFPHFYGALRVEDVRVRDASLRRGE